MTCYTYVRMSQHKLILSTYCQSTASCDKLKMEHLTYV